MDAASVILLTFGVIPCKLLISDAASPPEQQVGSSNLSGRTSSASRFFPERAPSPSAQDFANQVHELLRGPK